MNDRKKDEHLWFWFSISPSWFVPFRMHWLLPTFRCAEAETENCADEQNRLHIRFPRKPYCHFNLLFVSPHYNARTHTHHGAHLTALCLHAETRTEPHITCALILVDLIFKRVAILTCCFCFVLVLSTSTIECVCVLRAISTVGLLWTIKRLDFICETNVVEMMGTYLSKGWIACALAMYSLFPIVVSVYARRFHTQAAMLQWATQFQLKIVFVHIQCTIVGRRMGRYSYF